MARVERELSPRLTTGEVATAESSAERAYRVLKDAIIQGTLAAGITVSEAQLARRLEMSRTPVHQAVARLEGDGWVLVAPRSGVRISPVEADDLEDVYETLMSLEGTAAARLAQRPPGVEEIDERLVEACARCEEALDAHDLRAWADRDNDLHTLLLCGCGNDRLRRAASTVADQAHRARLLTVQLRPWPTSSNEDHRRIVAAILQRDPAAARTALESHRRRGMATLVPIIRSLSPAGSRFLD